MRLSELAGRRVLVLGTGREGLAAARAVVGLASALLAADDNDGASAAAWRIEWGDAAPLLIAPQPADLLDVVDVVIASPGIGPRHPLRAALASAGIPVTSGSDLWLSQHAASTTAVTGSKGKSTTASLIHHLTNYVTVNLVANTVDKSPARAEARKFAMERLIALARQREPNRCKFSVERSIQGDGQQLAEAATQECFANIVSEQTGHPARNVAFERWFENQQLAEGKRSASGKPGTAQLS